MWNWIADETLRTKCKVKKWDYFNAMNIPDSERPSKDCYCCEYDSTHACTKCPLKWPSDRQLLMCAHKSYLYEDRIGLYGLWRSCSKSDYEKAARLAREIANLPERR